MYVVSGAQYEPTLYASDVPTKMHVVFNFGPLETVSTVYVNCNMSQPYTNSQYHDSNFNMLVGGDSPTRFDYPAGTTTCSECNPIFANIGFLRVYNQQLSQPQVCNLFNTDAAAFMRPIVDSLPSVISAQQGVLVVLNTTVKGENLLFSWSFNGIPIPGVSSPTFSLVAFPETTGLYTLTVSVNIAAGIMTNSISGLSVSTSTSVQLSLLTGTLSTNVSSTTTDRTVFFMAFFSLPIPILAASDLTCWSCQISSVSMADQIGAEWLITVMATEVYSYISVSFSPNNTIATAGGTTLSTPGNESPEIYILALSEPFDIIRWSPAHILRWEDKATVFVCSPLWLIANLTANGLTDPTLAQSWNPIFVNWTVDSFSSIPTALLDAIATANDATNLTLYIPPMSLTVGLNWTFNVSVVQNVSQTYGYSSISIHTVGSEVLPPYINVSSTTFLLYTSSVLNVSSSVTFDNCSGTIASSPQVAYLWFQNGTTSWLNYTGERCLAPNGSNITALGCHSTLTLQPFTLTPSTTYYFFVTAFIPSSPSPIPAKWAKVTVTVLSRSLIAIIAGSHLRFILATDNVALLFDASLSRDPDSALYSSVNGPAMTSLPYTFQWICYDTTTLMACTDLLSWTTSSVLNISSNLLQSGHTYNLTVIVSDTLSPGRTGAATVQVQVLADNWPVPAFLPVSAPIAASQPFLLQAQLVYPLTGAVISDASGFTITWSSANNLLLNLSTPGTVLSPLTLSNASSFSILISPNVMLPGQTYSLLLTCDGPQVTTVSEYTFTVIPPPYGGSCSVWPSSGSAVTTNFQVNCSHWISSALPLSYTLSYSASGSVSTNVQNLVVASSNATLRSVTLSPATTSNSVALLIATIQDYYGTQTQFVIQVTVLPLSSGAATTQLLLSQSSNLTQQAAANPAATISTATTLAAALQSTYNSTYVTLPATSSSGIPISCIANCSGHGTCSQATSASLVCSCLCNSGWYGSDCSLTQANVTASAAIRTNILTALALSVSSNGSSVVAAATALQDATAEPSELTETAVVSAVSAISTLVNFNSTQPPTYSISVTSAASLLNVMGAVTTVLTLGSAVEGANFSASVQQQVSSNIAAFTSRLGQHVLFGQTPDSAAINVVTPVISMQLSRQSSSQLNNKALSVTSSQNYTVSVALPSTFQLEVSNLPAVVDLNAVLWSLSPYTSSSAVMSSPVTSMTLMQSSTGSEISVSGLAQPIVFTLPITMAPSARFLNLQLNFQIDPSFGALSNALTSLVAELSALPNVTVLSTATESGITSNNPMLVLTVDIFNPPLNITQWFASLSASNALTWQTLGIISAYVSSISNGTSTSSTGSVALPACEYWNSTLGVWSSSGCTTSMEWSQGLVMCGCNHLTDFGTVFEDQFLSADWAVLGTSANWSNPAGFIFVVIANVFFLVLGLLGLKKDISEYRRQKAQSPEKILAAAQLLYQNRRENERLKRLALIMRFANNPETSKLLSAVLKTKATLWTSLSHHHDYLSPFTATTAETFSYSARLLVLWCTFMLEMMVSALWYNVNTPESPSDIQVKISRAMISAIISTPLAVITAVLFSKSSFFKRQQLQFSEMIKRHFAAIVIQRSFRYRRKLELAKTPQAWTISGQPSRQQITPDRTKQTDKASRFDSTGFVEANFVDASHIPTLSAWLELITCLLSLCGIAFCSYYITDLGFALGNTATLNWLLTNLILTVSDFILIVPVKVVILVVVLPKLLKSDNANKLAATSTTSSTGSAGTGTTPQSPLPPKKSGFALEANIKIDIANDMKASPKVAVKPQYASIPLSSPASFLHSNGDTGVTLVSTIPTSPIVIGAFPAVQGHSRRPSGFSLHFSPSSGRSHSRHQSAFVLPSPVASSSSGTVRTTPVAAHSRRHSAFADSVSVPQPSSSPTGQIHRHKRPRSRGISLDPVPVPVSSTASTDAADPALIFEHFLEMYT